MSASHRRAYGRAEAGGPRAARRLVFLALLIQWVLTLPAMARQTFVFEQEPLRAVIEAVQERTAYRFLYRDALVSGRSVSLVSDASHVLEDLEQALARMGLAMQVDAGRGQVLLFERRREVRAGTLLQGSVLDAESGIRLPYATVSWRSDGTLRGAVTDEHGTFRMELPAGTGPIDLTGSFIGYEPATVRVDPADPPGELAVRLDPRAIPTAEVVVRSTMLHTDVDTTWHRLMQPGSLAPVGETGVLRALQTLPGVSITNALSDGLSVRGSRADGFQVLLDGMPIYAQTHLFGLFDAFNEDAIQTVGFFYGIAPASYQAPPGGTVSFLTRPGSRTRFGGSAGLSATSARATLEGPIGAGRGSWLVSSRRSIIGSVDWFGNADLLAQGLDVGRPTSAPAEGVALPSAGLEVRSAPDARYFDVHGKMMLETRAGDQLSLSGYAGGDRAGYDAMRVLRQSNGQAGMGGPVVRQRADTDQEWGNATLSATYRRTLGDRTLSTFTGGFSRFHGTYEKADFVFSRREQESGPPATPGRPEWQLGTFSNRSALEQWRLAADLDWVGVSGMSWQAGTEINGYRNTYRERSIDRPEFEAKQRSAQVDAYVGAASPPHRALASDTGLRIHWYGLGNRVGLSPRLSLRLRLAEAVTLTAGASRNYQFLHRITLEHVPTVDIWTLSGEDEKPGRVDYATAGLYARTKGSLAIQVEVYVKRYRNLRLHELAARERLVSNASVFLNPWLWDADGNARGLETMLRYRIGRLDVAHAYTWSRILLHHPGLNGGRDFPAYWDRRHQATTSVRVPLGRGFALTTAWAVASGTPNTLSYQDDSEPARLPVYHRMDLVLSGSIGSAMELRLGVYNLYDRDNAWYRTVVPVVVSQDQPGRLLQTTTVYVYDLGIQPTVEVSVRF